jgi:AcrR family transcriptional regulator
MPDHARTPRRRPRGEMRQRILDVALELFNEQGYDKTSLREIADRLGVTKAALYYHFERKEDILLELHLRLHELGRDVLERLDALEDERDAYRLWPELVDRFIDGLLANRDLFLLHQRNHNAMEQLLDNERHRQENDDIEQRFRRFLADAKLPIGERVRMIASIGAVFAALIGTADLFGDDVDQDAVVAETQAVVRDLLSGVAKRQQG